MSVRREDFEKWWAERAGDKEAAWLAFLAGWEAGVENYRGGEWDYT